jgi:HSP20 family protein
MFNLTPWRRHGSDGGQLAPRNEFPLNRIRDDFDALFDRFFTNWPAPFEGWGREGAWGLQVEDAEKEVVVRADAPGFEAGDFDIQISGNLLTLRAEQKKEEKEKESGSYYAERRLQRSVTLPAGVDPEKVEARYRNGVLELKLPKTPEAQAKRIEVKV